MDPSSAAEHTINELLRMLGEDHQSLKVGLWYLEEVIHQMLFHSGQWDYHIQEVLAATNQLYQAREGRQDHSGVP